MSKKVTKELITPEEIIDIAKSIVSIIRENQDTTKNTINNLSKYIVSEMKKDKSEIYFVLKKYSKKTKNNKQILKYIIEEISRIIRRKPENIDKKNIDNIIEFIKYEIDRNTNISQELKDYKKKLFEDKFLTPDKFDKRTVQYHDEIDEEMDINLIYRNFLLLLHFMNTFINHREKMEIYIEKDKDYFLNQDNNLGLSTLFNNLFIYGTIRKNSEDYNAQDIQKTFNNFIHGYSKRLRKKYIVINKFSKDPKQEYKLMNGFPIKPENRYIFIKGYSKELDLELKNRYIIDNGYFKKPKEEFIFINGYFPKENSFIEEFPIDINFSNMLFNSKSVDIGKDKQEEQTVRNIRAFYRSFKSLSELSLQSSIRLFWESIEGKHNNKNIPQSLNSFLRYYILNDTYGQRSNHKSLNVSGVGYDSLVSRLVLDEKNIGKKGYESAKELEVTIEDKDSLSQQCRYIHFKLIDSDYDTKDIEELDFHSTTYDNNIDICISIPPTHLPTYMSEEFLEISSNKNTDFKRFKGYFPLPTKNLSILVHYYHTIKLMKSKSFVVVPLSFLSLMNLNKSGSVGTDTDSINNDSKYFSRNKIHETALYNQRIKEIIDEQHIKKIMLLPKGMMTHTNEQCVLLELSKERVEGVHILDSVSKFSTVLNSQLTLDNRKYKKKLKDVFDNQDTIDVYVDKNSKIVSPDSSKEKFLVSKYVSYSDIKNPDKYDYNLLPSYHFTDTEDSDESSVFEVLDDFIIKSQRKTFKDGSDILHIVGQTEFGKYGITDVSKVQKFHNIILKKNQYLLKNGDILLYETYKTREHMTYIEMDETLNALSPNNTFIIRTENIELSKEIFMYLYSDEGQNKLCSLVKSNGSKEVLTVEPLKKLTYKKTGKSFDDYKIKVSKILGDEEKLLKFLR